MKKNLVSLAALVICAATLSGCCCGGWHGCGGSGSSGSGSGILTMNVPAPAHAATPTQPA